MGWGNDTSRLTWSRQELLIWSASKARWTSKALSSLGWELGQLPPNVCSVAPWTGQLISSHHGLATWGILHGPSALCQPGPRCRSIRPLGVGTQGPTSTLKLEYSLPTQSPDKSIVFLGFLAMSRTLQIFQSFDNLDLVFS